MRCLLIDLDDDAEKVEKVRACGVKKSHLYTGLVDLQGFLATN